MFLRYNYFYYQAVLTPSQCKQIIDTGLKELDNRKKVYGNTKGVTRDGGEYNSNKTIRLDNDKKLKEYNNDDIKNIITRDSDVAFLGDKWVYDLIIPYVQRANVDAGWNFDIDYYEGVQFTVYKDNGFYGWHTDGGSDFSFAYKKQMKWLDQKNGDTFDMGGETPDINMVGKVRKLSMTINLSDPNDYEGGDLKIDTKSLDEESVHNISEIKPQGSLVVFPSYLYHQVTPVTKGTRYSLVVWCLGKPFK
jgi:PKHD-type hydroxylase